MIFDTGKSIIQEISDERLKNRNIKLFVKRDDLIHPEVSGNKWRKLKYIIEHFRQSKNENILTFGGAYSNHLLATASACNSLRINAIGIVRGEELNFDSNDLLKRCNELGMQLHFVSREEYTLRGMKEYHEELIIQFPNSYIIPEGGANYYGMIGCQELVNELPEYDHIFVAQGTTTTSCGILLGVDSQELHVVPAIKNFDSKGEMRSLYRKSGFDDETIDELFERLNVHNEYHFGGYAKQTNELTEFIDLYNNTHHLPLDKVYTSKAFYGMMQELQGKQYDDSTTIFIHTGGLLHT
jgi:1-aminocyclopropane-1-carboxylate deaminase